MRGNKMQFIIGLVIKEVILDTAASLESIYNFLLGTSTDVWLRDAENNVK